MGKERIIYVRFDEDQMKLMTDLKKRLGYKTYSRMTKEILLKIYEHPEIDLFLLGKSEMSEMSAISEHLKNIFDTLKDNGIIK